MGYRGPGQRFARMLGVKGGHTERVRGNGKAGGQLWRRRVVGDALGEVGKTRAWGVGVAQKRDGGWGYGGHLYAHRVPSNKHSMTSMRARGWVVGPLQRSRALWERKAKQKGNLGV